MAEQPNRTDLQFAEKVQEADLKQFPQTTLPTLKQRLRHVRGLQ